ncbi:hypothetical protein [Spirosoma sp. KCTC 42546]|uniref:hypothetical protein n=1 Tax=Spirosoma sp. KCTC 42546 TaxID=2520506 RepID=UPI00143D9AB0|nr:hypothetical protein [Spirosoma sp. KCTC 42546]
MKSPKDAHLTASVIVPTKVLKGKDGREPFAEKLERANKVLERAGLPEQLKKK